MKKGIIIFIVIVLAVVVGIMWYNFENNSNNSDTSNSSSTKGTNYQAEKSNTNINITNQNGTDEENDKEETIISEFATKIHNKDSERQNNITITCKTLNGIEVKPGETFSFCNTVGKSTSDKGYQEADVYVEGKKEQALGGGNCQVSTTLYNAVLQIPELEVLERHEHSGYVPYIEKGKDAAVAFGSYDFKFKNNTDSTIKIVMDNSADNIVARILKVS